VSLKHALLALLEARPMTGYEIAKQFDTSANYLWHAPHSQIYPELRRLESAGLISAAVVPRGEKAVKRRYSLTQAGLEELIRWVNEPQELPKMRDAVYLKATYYEFGSYDNAIRQFEEHLKFYTEQKRFWELHVQDLENRRTALIQMRLAKAPPEQHDAIVAYKVHAYKGLIDRAHAEIRWAREGITLIRNLMQAQEQSSDGGH
jgi:PadR family transcriptional regulator, regulatory protein AphA